MLEVSTCGLRYARFLADSISPEEIEQLKKKFSYLFLIVYGNVPPASGFVVQRRQVSMIDLTQGMDTVFAKFKSNTRNKIRNAAKNKTLTFVSDDRNFDKAYERYKKFERSRGWMPSLRAEIKNSVLFSAYYNNAVIAGIACYGHNDILRVSKIYSTRNHNTKEGWPNNSVIGYAGRKVVYDACRYGIENGYRRFDLGGINFIDPAKSGISEFKASFGGAIIDVYLCRYMTKYFSLFKRVLALAKKDIT